MGAEKKVLWVNGQMAKIARDRIEESFAIGCAIEVLKKRVPLKVIYHAEEIRVLDFPKMNQEFNNLYAAMATGFPLVDNLKLISNLEFRRILESEKIKISALVSSEFHSEIDCMRNILESMQPPVPIAFMGLDTTLNIITFGCKRISKMLSKNIGVYVRNQDFEYAVMDSSRVNQNDAKLIEGNLESSKNAPEFAALVSMTLGKSAKATKTVALKSIKSDYMGLNNFRFERMETDE